MNAQDVRTLSLSEVILNHTRPTAKGAVPPPVFLKCDVEGAEYDLLPHLLTTGALCRVTHLYMEWHLNSVPPTRRLAALALRTTLEHTLHRGCVHPPVWYEHDEYDVNNLEEEVPGLWQLALLHNGTPVPGSMQRNPFAKNWAGVHGAGRAGRAKAKPPKHY